jgi:hypothetical protein
MGITNDADLKGLTGWPVGFTDNNLLLGARKGFRFLVHGRFPQGPIGLEALSASAIKPISEGG